jgi:hypothetical protein
MNPRSPGCFLVMSHYLFFSLMQWDPGDRELLQPVIISLCCTVLLNDVCIL